MEQNQNNEIDIRKIVRVVLEHWWWFVIGVSVFVGMGLLYYYRTTPKLKTDASIVLRLQEMTGNKLGALSLLGMTAGSGTSDEVIVLSSRGLMAQSLDALIYGRPRGLKTACSGRRNTASMHSPSSVSS